MRAALVTAVCVFGFAGMASAVPTIGVEFDGLSTITVTSSSAVVTAEFYIDMTNDPGTSGYTMSVEWDSAGQNILDFVSGTELAPLGQNITPGCCNNGVTESTAGNPGVVENDLFDSADLTFPFENALGGTKFLIGTVQFHVTANTGVTNITPFFSLGQGILNVFELYPTVNLVGGTVIHPVPEPGTAALLALGLLAVTVAGRRRRA